MRRKNIILLSPHLDDIAFSIGGLVNYLSNDYNELILINVFNKSSYCLPTFSTACIDEQRTKEDQNYATRFKLSKIDFNLPDSSKINHTDNSEVICAPNDRRRMFLIIELNKIFNNLNPDIIFCPLSIGGHIDHKMVKEVCIELSSIHAFDNIIFYEDLPYASNFKTYEVLQIIKATINFKLIFKNINIEPVWINKEESIKYYESQVNQSIIDKIKNYSLNLGRSISLYERIWSSSQYALSLIKQ